MRHCISYSESFVVDFVSFLFGRLNTLFVSFERDEKIRLMRMPIFESLLPVPSLHKDCFQKCVNEASIESILPGDFFSYFTDSICIFCKEKCSKEKISIAFTSFNTGEKCCRLFATNG